MELRILGCHGGETPKHKTSSFLLDGKLAIDAGAVTSMLTLEEQHAIETVLISHAHLDHVRDLATLADNRCQQGGPPLVIAAIPETLAVLRKHFFNDLLWPDFSRIPAADGGMTIVFQPLVPEETSELSGMKVTPVLVHHTIDAAGFVVETPTGSLGYSGDTGPTTRFWERLAEERDLRALLMEISFPDEHHKLAKVSGHHTPETLEAELHKLRDHRELPILLYHIKPVFEQRVEKELARIRDRNLDICRLGDQFIL
ncbi:MAG: 3',5'-cyclic-nucleotide phosphodiesterase [Myxococcota bacterium]|nr:3',5'-cyclic-nucleotide phosphodiesterase [Myxococcota bacterium]